MSRQTDSKVPAIRFRGFDEDWQEKRIGKVVSETKRPIILEDDQRYELVTVRRRNRGVVSRGYLYGREILVKNYSQLADGDFLISKRQVVHGATGLVPPTLDGAIVSNEYLVAVGNSDISTEFLTLISKLPAMYRKFFLSSYGVDIEKLFFDVEDWSNRSIAVPVLDEQSEISTWFKTLDRMAGLHQRKHDKLVMLKQAMLQRMFPQDGATTPEIRFKGFKGDWQASTLEEVVEVCSGRDYKHLSSGNIPVYGTGGYMVSVDEALSYDHDAIGIGRKGTIDKPYLLECPFWTVDTLFYAVPLDANDLDFVFSVFQRVDWRKRDESTGVPSLSKFTINQIEVLVPDPGEQTRIGAYFYKLDELIARHATQLEKLKKIKSACLDKMFV